MTIRELLEKHPQGLTIDEIRLKTGLSHKTIKDALSKLPVECDIEGIYYLVNSPEHRAELKEMTDEKQKAKANKTTPPKRSKPFTPNPTRGYEVKGGKVKIFLDRKASSRTLTLYVDDLRELLRAVEKAG